MIEQQETYAIAKMTMFQFNGSIAINGPNYRRRDQYLHASQRHPKMTNATFVVLQKQLLMVVLFKLLVCNYVSTTTAFLSQPHKCHTSSFQQQQRLSTTLMSVSQQRNQQRLVATNQDNTHRSPLVAILTRRERRLWATTRLNASIQSPQNLKPYQLLGRTRQEDNINRRQNTTKRELKTLLRVGIPSILAGVLAYLVFPYLAMTLASSVTSAGALTVLSTDSSQFVQNFLSVSSLLFSILVGQTCKLSGIL